MNVSLKLLFSYIDFFQCKIIFGLASNTFMNDKRVSMDMMIPLFYVLKSRKKTPLLFIVDIISRIHRKELGMVSFYFLS